MVQAAILPPHVRHRDGWPIAFVHACRRQTRRIHKQNFRREYRNYQTNWQTVQIGSKWWGLSAARVYDFATGQFTSRDPLPITAKLSDTPDGVAPGIFSSTIFIPYITRRAHSGISNNYSYADNVVTQYVDAVGLDRIQNCVLKCIASRGGNPLLSFNDCNAICNQKYIPGDYGCPDIPRLPKNLRDWFQKQNAEWMDESEDIGNGTIKPSDYHDFWDAVNDLKDTSGAEVAVRRGVSSAIVNAGLKSCDHIIIIAHGGPGDATTKPGVESTVPNDNPIDWTIKNPGNPNRSVHIASCYGQNIADYLRTFGINATGSPGSLNKEVKSLMDLLDITKRLKELKTACPLNKKTRICIFIATVQHIR